jgi:hypothetical protein
VVSWIEVGEEGVVEMDIYVPVIVVMKFETSLKSEWVYAMYFMLFV